eukprot:jgi/Mesen1/8944/ME000553S08413
MREMDYPQTRLPFKMPTVDNLIPIRLDLDIEGIKVKDAFTWHADEPDAEILPFVRRMVKEEELPAYVVPHVVQAIQEQVLDFRSLEGQEWGLEERLQLLKLDLRVNGLYIRDQFLWDVNNPASDPDAFARQLCKDIGIEDRQVAPALSVAIREQIYEIVRMGLGGRESRSSKKARHRTSTDFFTPPTKLGNTGLAYMRRPNGKISVLRYGFLPPVTRVVDSK